MLALALALIIGAAVGLLGGGGSLLTVPVFTSVLGYQPREAVAMSLPVVGLAAVAGAAWAWRHGTLRLKPGLVTGLAAMAGAAAGARLAHELSGRTQMMVLTVTMLTAAALTLRGAGRRPRAPGPRRPHPAPLALSGFGTGLLTGLVGVGGGFLIVPALAGAGGLPMREAVGTSLLVMSLSAAAGFAGYAGRVAIAWPTVLLFGGIAAAGSVAGHAVAARVPSWWLRRIFAVVLTGLACYMLVRG